MATRIDTFSDSDYSAWWSGADSLNGAISFGEGSPVANAVGLQYSTDPSGADWGTRRLQSKFTVPTTDDIVVRGNYVFTGGDAGSQGHSLWCGFRDINTPAEYLIAVVRTAGGGETIWTYTGNAGVHDVGNWTNFGGVGATFSDAMLDVFWRTDGYLKFSIRDDALNWTTIREETGITLGSTCRPLMHWDMWWNDYSRNDYPITAVFDNLYLSAASFSDLESPVFQSAAINVAGTQVTITFDEALAGTADGITLIVGVLDNPLTRVWELA